MPQGRVVYDADSAVRAAAELGYPVVVKPLDGNQGRGVSTNIMTEDGVRAAFGRARDIRRSVVVEIYTRIYLRNAGMSGRKLRSRAELNLALKGLGSPPVRLRFEPNDHQTDALVTAAGMRQLAKGEPRAFDPEGLTPEIARSEGWTFGVL